MADPDIGDLERRMSGAVSVLRQEFGGLRTGRASTSLLEPIVVEAYGAQMPLPQVATISVPEARLLTIQVWDKANVAAVEKAVRGSGLGLNPIVDGQLLRLPVPELTEERRTELTKIAAKYSEQARIAVRNVRRDGMEQLKRMEKDSEIGKDDHRFWSQEIQEMTDKKVEEIDQVLATKEKEIMQV